MGEEVATTHGGVEPCTHQVRAYMVPPEHPTYENVFKKSGGRIFLIDTPGFDFGDFGQRLQEIMLLLKSATSKGVNIVGVAYIVSTHANQMGRRNRLHFEVFSSVCGEEFLRKVVLCITSGDSSNRSNATELRIQDFNSTIRKERLTNHPECANRVLQYVAETAALDSGAPKWLGDGAKTTTQTLISKVMSSEYGVPALGRLFGAPRQVDDCTLVILLGQTGVGKSSFINDLLVDSRAIVNHAIMPTRPSVDHFKVPTADRNSVLTFVECPGFNREDIPDSKISDLICDFFDTSSPFSPQSTVLGIVYLLDTWGPSVENPGYRILGDSRVTCGKVLGVTTSRPDTLEKNPFKEHSLVKHIVQQGVPMEEYTYDSPNYAWNVIAPVLGGTSMTLSTFLQLFRSI
ncbi:hypothetical protein FA15DRAFT_759360 [Coprinopsis marcescibilis]|uniref:G domain-containing protein n=1 Tax=Coprinopsis marcescibilis TaxID=230819 RepID=A0A5C3KJV1_COPMA|nr:hypothetical protein FA15DRAFT_759360 [Coprinopsis marcescibilis]